MIKYLIFAMFLGFETVFAQVKPPNQCDTVLLLMGSRFEIAAVAYSKDTAQMAIEAAINTIKQIENQISCHVTQSGTSQINHNAGLKSVKVDLELYNLILRSKKISDITDGAFDISFAPMLKVWNFKKFSGFPPNDTIEKYRQLVNYQNIVLNKNDTSVFLTKPGMLIGFGAIGKGYAANMGKKAMLKYNLLGGFVNASGDNLFFGKNKSGNLWRVAITNPLNKREVLGGLEVGNMSVVTSGDYENYFDYKGKRYSHIIDPRTGLPSISTHSVTIICADAELADALATSVSVLGPENGLKLINQLNGVECLIVNSSGELVQSKNLKLLPIK